MQIVQAVQEVSELSAQERQNITVPEDGTTMSNLAPLSMNVDSDFIENTRSVFFLRPLLENEGKFDSVMMPLPKLADKLHKEEADLFKKLCVCHVDGRQGFLDNTADQLFWINLQKHGTKKL